MTKLGSEESLTAYVELALRLQIEPAKARLLVDSVAGARQYWTLLFQHAPDMQTKEKALAAMATPR